MKNKAQSALVLFIVVCLVLPLGACNMPGMAATSDPSVEETRVALGIQSTMLAMQQQTLEAAQNIPTAMPTYTPYPTYTPEPPTVEVPAVTAEVAPIQPQEPSPTVDMQARIRSANILVYEDIRGYPELLPFVHETINNMGFSGGKIVEVGDAVGDFKDQLLSSTKWDLIIVASESRGTIRGEFWEYIMTHVNNDVALVVEMWYLDDIANGKVAALLGKCGVKYQKDWTFSPGANPLDFSIYILDPNSEVFSNPNSGITLSNPSYFYWQGDVGDLLKVGPGGDAKILAGLYPKEKSSYGLITSCLDGRVIIQTFDTHDFDPYITKALWENYITTTLTHHFMEIDKK